MKRKRSFVLGSALFAVTVVGLLVWTIPTKYSRRSQRLPDGSSLKIVSISYGTKHSLVWPHRKPWESFLVANLSRSLTAKLGWETTGGSVGMSPPPGETSIAIFTLHEPLKSEVSARALMTGSSGFKVDLCDERGTVYTCEAPDGTCVVFDHWADDVRTYRDTYRGAYRDLDED